MAHEIVHVEIGGRDLDALSAFYEQLFGWKATGFDADYRMVTAGEGIGGGLMRCRDGVPPYVTFYVSVEDPAATLARAKELGGSELVPPTAIPNVGTFALFSDPEGHTIGILAPAAVPAAAG